MTAGMEKMVADHPCYLKKLKEKIDMKKLKISTNCFTYYGIRK